MTKNDIIKLARKAGLYTHKDVQPEILAFAALVAAAEREACAKLCEDEAWRLKKLAVDAGSSSTNTKAIQASNDADAIRARGNT